MQSQVKQGIETEGNQQSSQKDQSQNKTVQKKGTKSTKQASLHESSPIQTKQGDLSPYSSKEGQKPPISRQTGTPYQAKQRPVQRNTGSSGGSGKVDEAQIKANVSSIMGTDVTQAKVNYNSSKPAQLKAEAYAQGNTVEIAPGKEKHLGHELAHIGQQAQGRVQATTSRSGTSEPQQANNGVVNINDDPKLEKEADDIGAKAHNMQPTQMKSVDNTTTTSSPSTSSSAPVQGYFYDSIDGEQRVMSGELTTIIESFKKSSEYNELVIKHSEEAKVTEALTILTVGDYYNGKLIAEPNKYLNKATYVSIASAVTHVIETNAKADKNYTELSGKTFKELIALAKTQADWHTKELGNKDRSGIRWAMSFAREPNVEATLGNFKVDDFFKLLEKTSSNEELLNPLREYARVSKTDEPLKINDAASLKLAMETGERLLLIQQAIPVWMINKNLKQDLFVHFDKAAIAQLKDYNEKGLLKPYFQSNEDFRGFLYHWKGKNKNPVSYDGTATKGHIRNYHRFQNEALDQLATNFADKSKPADRPLTLIIHSALDHGGAFNHDTKLTEVVKNPKMLTLMLEGKGNLADYTKEIDGLAQGYSKSGKIDQIMMAGHGASTLMQMGGKIEDENGKVKEVHDSIDIKDNEEATRALFDKLLDNMNKTGDGVKEEHRRILFNACLTNSVTMLPKFHGSDVDKYQEKNKKILDEWHADGADENKTRLKMQEWLSKNHNLVSYVTARAKEKGAAVDKVVGSMAAHKTLDMFDPKNNNLELISKEDPYLTAKDKKDYVINGVELEGVLKALAVCWTNPDKSYRDGVYDEVKKRAVKGSKDWQNATIECMFALLKDNPGLWGNFHVLNGLSLLASAFLHANIDSESSALSIKNGVLNAYTYSGGQITFDYLVYFYNKLSTATDWTGKDYIPFNFLQAFTGLGDDRFIPFLHQHIDNKYATIKDMHEYLNIPVLQNGADMKKILKATDDPASLKLALASMVYGPMDAEAKAYLIKHTTDNAFNASAKIPSLIAGAATEDELLVTLGLVKGPDNKDGKADNKVANVPNVTLTDSSKVYVQPTTLEATIKADGTSVYQKADDKSTELAKLTKDASVFILGSSGGYWAIEHAHQNKKSTAFVKKTEANNAKSLTAG